MPGWLSSETLQDCCQDTGGMRSAGSQQWLRGVGGVRRGAQEPVLLPFCGHLSGTAWGEVGLQIGFSFFFPHMDHLKNLYCICYNAASVLCFVFLASRTIRILAPQPGMEPTTPALGGKVLSTGPPGSPFFLFFFLYHSQAAKKISPSYQDLSPWRLHRASHWGFGEHGCQTPEKTQVLRLLLKLEALSAVPEAPGEPQSWLRITRR